MIIRDRISAPAASNPAMAGCTMPVASRSTSPARTATATLPPDPSAPPGVSPNPVSSRPARRGRRVEVERLPGSLKQQCVARSQRWPRGIRSMPARWDRDTDQIAAVGHMPGKTVRPIRPERGGMTTSARPDVFPNSAEAGSSGRPSSRRARCSLVARLAIASALPRTTT